MLNPTLSASGRRSAEDAGTLAFVTAFITTLTVALIVSSSIGCFSRRPDASSVEAGSDDANRNSGSWQGTPSELLKSVFARYASAEAYHDNGQVRLSYESDGRHQSELAPLRVWLDRGVLDVAAYDVRIRQGRAGTADAVMSAWIVDPATNPYDSQVLQKVTTLGRPTLESILSDLVLADRLQAGLAGPPPQLEWLLADEPMKRLFDDRHRFEYADSELVEGHRCHVVRVEASGDRYLFWIDQKQGVIRRVELPLLSIPLVASTSSTLKLTLELSDASFGSPKRSLPPVSLPPRPRFVTRFLPLPPTEPLRVLGTRADGYRLVDSSGKVVLDANSVDHKIVVLGRFVGGETSVAHVALLQNWNSRLPPEIAKRIQTIVVVDDSVVDQIPSALALTVAVDNDNAAGRQFSLTPYGLTILDDHGQIVWLLPQVTPDSLVDAGTIIAVVIRGIDVPGRLREQWQQNVRDYQDALDKVSIRNPVLIP